MVKVRSFVCYVLVNAYLLTLNRPGLLADSVAVEASRTSPFQRACLLAAQAPHSGDWLLALPLTACGLRLEDEAVRIAAGWRRGAVVSGVRQ